VNEGLSFHAMVTLNIVFRNIITLFPCLLKGFLGFCSDVDEVTDLPGFDALSNPRRIDTTCPFKYEPLRALTHLQALLNCAMDCC
jgi:hypothetical protein